MKEIVDRLHNHNLFLVMGKYVQRQDENLLTQSLVLLFNRVAPFRELLWTRLGGNKTFPQLESSNLLAYSQVRRTAHGRSVLVDMEIRGNDDRAPFYLVECKLDSGLGAKQLNGYKSALKKIGKAQLVVVTRYGIDDELWNIAPKNTIWISWSAVAEIALQSIRRASKLDRLLLRDFLDMTKSKGIDVLPAISANDWKRLKRLSSFTLNAASLRINYRALAAIEATFRKLIAFRDAAWEPLFSRKDKWHPYQAIYKTDDDHVVLYACFYRENTGKQIAESQLGLELSCVAKPRLYVLRGQFLRTTHKRYARGKAYEQSELSRFTPAETKRLFRGNVASFLERHQMRLTKTAKRFLESPIKK